MRTHLLAPLAALGLLLTVTACGEDAASTSSATDDKTVHSAPPKDARQSVVVLEGRDEKKADLQLWVSNQSFVDDPVHLTVTVDGDLVVDEDFEVGSQHNWVSFPLQLPTGEHEIEVEAGTGPTLTKTFVTPESGDKRYAVVNYWNYDDKDGRYLEWSFEKEPIYFM